MLIIVQLNHNPRSTACFTTQTLLTIPQYYSRISETREHSLGSQSALNLQQLRTVYTNRQHAVVVIKVAIPSLWLSVQEDIQLTPPASQSSCCRL
jgi:hypothetical protein